MRRMVLVAFLGFLFVSNVKAGGVDEVIREQIQQGIFELNYAAMQVDAIDNDMYLYYGWMPEEKEGWRKASIRSTKKLEENKVKVASLNLPVEMSDVKRDYVELINMLQAIYDGIELKETEDIVEEYKTYQQFGEEYNMALKALIDEYIKINPPENGFKVLDMEKSLIEEKDRDEYERIANLSSQGEDGCNEAFGDLESFVKKYKGTDIELTIKLRIANCLYYATKENFGFEYSYEDRLTMLLSIIEDGRYSPKLYDAFVEWRTEEQTMNHGMSNWSEIPNEEYNIKRWQVVKNIQRYLQNNPEDEWAKVQILLLLDIPNIKRGGQFGNSNINFAYRLHEDSYSTGEE